MNRKNFEKEIESLTMIKKSKGMSAAVYKLKEKVLGPKEPLLDAMPIEDPESGVLITDPEEINEATLKYCLGLLEDRKPKPEYKEIYEKKLDLHKQRMTEHVDNDMDELNYVQFTEALTTVAKKHSDKYKFLLKAGQSLLDALFRLFQLVWRHEEIPEKWRESLLLQKLKNPNKTSLDNIRFLHLKSEVPKLFSQIVFNSIKSDLFANMTKFQIATKPGHRSSEHLFVIFSMIALCEASKDAILISMYDISKYFDSESVFDCCAEVYKSQIKGKLYRLLFNLNKRSKIRIKTSVGESRSAETDPIVTQGSIEAAVCSAVNLDSGIKEFFHDAKDDKDDNEDNKSKDEKEEKETDDVKYSDIELKPMLFQDDVLAPNKTPESAQRTNNKIVDLMESKLLDLHRDKSCYIVAGEKGAKMKMKRALEKKPLTLYEEKMKEVKTNKYLGCLLSSTVTESVTDTINSRLGLAKRAIYEIRTIVEDSRAEHLGAIQVGLDLWRGSVLPSLLYSSEVWTEIPKKMLTKLNEVNSLFLANLMGVSKRGCPEVCLYVETSSLLMSNQILLSQLLFLHHVATLPADTLANETYQAMKANGYPGLYKICKEYLNEWGMSNVESYTKWMWKERIKKQIQAKNWRDLEEWSTKYKKITPEQVKEKKENPSAYIKTLNLHESRILFRKASSTIHTVRLNWKNNRRYREEGYDCIDCLELNPPVRHPDHQDILVTSTCQGNSDLRNTRDMSNPRDTAQFFIDLISRRNRNYGGHA